MFYSNKSKPSNYVSLDVKRLFKDCDDVLQATDNFFIIQEYKDFRRSFFEWRYKKIGRLTRFFYRNRLKVGFYQYVKMLWISYHKSSRKWNTEFCILKRSNRYTDDIGALKRMASIAIDDGKKEVFVNQEHYITLDNGKSFIKKYKDAELPWDLESLVSEFKKEVDK